MLIVGRQSQCFELLQIHYIGNQRAPKRNILNWLEGLAVNQGHRLLAGIENSKVLIALQRKYLFSYNIDILESLSGANLKILK